MSYFDNFPETKQVKGIPNVDMRIPLGPRAVTGDVGIEFEIEATNRLPWDSKGINQNSPPCAVTGGIWTAKEDNSLRGGVEYVTSSAVAISSVRPLVTGLYKSISDYKAIPRFSNRCSTHVHLNASTWKINKIVSFYALWSLLEPVLIDWCGPKRKTNHFCLSIKDSPSTADVLTGYLKSGMFGFTDGDKYSALNLMRLHDLGTLEVRCGDAWQDPEKMIQWIHLLNEMKDYAASIESPSVIPAVISGDTPLGLLTSLCQKAGASLILSDITSRYDEREFNRECYGSFRETIHMCYFPWDEWLPMINADYVPNPFSEKSKGIPLRGIRAFNPVPDQPVWRRQPAPARGAMAAMAERDGAQGFPPRPQADPFHPNEIIEAFARRVEGNN